MAFSDKELDEIRARLKVSDVVGSYIKLDKRGAEYVAKGNESFTVNDGKGFWCEFGAGGDAKPHDIFDYLEIYQGYTFVDAVKELAGKAGVALGGAGSDRTRTDRKVSSEKMGSGESVRGPDAGDPRFSSDGPVDAGAGAARPAQGGKNEVVAEWDYRDPENVLLYQVVRLQKRLPDGSWQTTKDGSKPWKTFMQRRPSPDGDGSWVAALDFCDRETGEPFEFVKSERSNTWLRANEDRLQWRNITVRKFAGSGNVEHYLYNANEVLDELQEPPEDQRPIFMPEGEGKVDVVREWGLLATCNSGGAKHFTEGCAEFFRNAGEVVILADNDRAGAERVAKIGPMLRAVGVRKLTVLNFRDIWPGCPVKGDVKDWRDKGGGTREALLDAVDGLPEWTPEPYKSQFGAKTSRDLATPAKAYPWRIKGIAPLNETFLIVGPSQSGKTFETLDIVMHVCTSKPTFAGRKVTPGGVIYLAYEGTSGFENRVRAYMKHHGLTDADLHSFAWLTKPPNLFTDEANVFALAKELNEIAAGFKLPLGIVVIDTHNASTRGSSEVKSDEIGKIMNHHDIVARETGVRPWIIGHTNSEGKHRGNEQFYNTIETVMLIERQFENNDPKKAEKRDDLGRVIRRAKMKKQRDGSDEVHWDFVLEKVIIGIDEDGEQIPSMVSVEPARAASQEVERGDGRAKPNGYVLNAGEATIFKGMLAMLDEKGVAPPGSLGLPSSIKKVITYGQLGEAVKKIDPQEGDESLDKYKNRIKARTRRFRDAMRAYNVLGMADVVVGDRTQHYIWPTEKRVVGKGLVWPPLRAQDQMPKHDPHPDLLPPAEGDSDEIPF